MTFYCERDGCWQRAPCNLHFVNLPREARKSLIALNLLFIITKRNGSADNYQFATFARACLRADITLGDGWMVLFHGISVPHIDIADTCLQNAALYSDHFYLKQIAHPPFVAFCVGHELECIRFVHMHHMLVSSKSYESYVANHGKAVIDDNSYAQWLQAERDVLDTHLLRSARPYFDVVEEIKKLWNALEREGLKKEFIEARFGLAALHYVCPHNIHFNHPFSQGVQGLGCVATLGVCGYLTHCYEMMALTEHDFALKFQLSNRDIHQKAMDALCNGHRTTFKDTMELFLQHQTRCDMYAYHFIMQTSSACPFFHTVHAFTILQVPQDRSNPVYCVLQAYGPYSVQGEFSYSMGEWMEGKGKCKNSPFLGWMFFDQICQFLARGFLVQDLTQPRWLRNASHEIAFAAPFAFPDQDATSTKTLLFHSSVLPGIQHRVQILKQQILDDAKKL